MARRLSKMIELILLSYNVELSSYRMKSYNTNRLTSVLGQQHTNLATIKLRETSLSWFLTETRNQPFDLIPGHTGLFGASNRLPRI